MRKSEMSEINKFLGSLGIDEDIWNQMANSYTENFMIQGEETTRLEQILNRAPETLLDLILKNWTEETDADVSREEKERCVYELVIRSFEKEFVFLDKEDLEVMAKSANGHPLSGMQLATAQENYCRKGWLFMFCENNGCIFVMPDEIRERMLTNLQDEKMQSQLGIVSGLRLTLCACMNLFGVVERKKVLQIAMDKMFGYPDLQEEEKKKLERAFEKAEEILQTLCQRAEGELWQEEEWLISGEFENRKQYKQFLRQVSGQEYYIPDQKEIFLYAEHLVDIENPCYKRMLKDLTRLMRDKTGADDLMFELEFMVAQNDFQTQDIMNLLFTRDIAFSSRKSGERFAENCGEWVHTVRKWSNRGFTDEELGKQKKELSMAVVSDWGIEEKQIPKKTPKTQKKIGRNDPCPCGSGKKYKKCCGK